MTVLERSVLCMLSILAMTVSAAYAGADPPPLPDGPEDESVTIWMSEDGDTEIHIVMPDTGTDGQQAEYSVEIIEMKDGDTAEAHRHDGQDGERVFEYAEQMPEFRDGEETNFTRWVMKRMEYPLKAMEEGIEGRVVVRFIVEKCGKIGNFEVLYSPDELLEQEVLRVMGQSPKWIPGKRYGKPVRVYYTLPVMFRLQ